MSRTIKPLVIPTVTDGQDLLIKLLGDDDQVVFDEVRNKIFSLGPDTLLWLRPLCLSDDPTLRRNARSIVHHFDCDTAHAHFVRYCSLREEDMNLEQGLLMMARTRYPEINIIAYRAVLDSMAGELREWLRRGANNSLLEQVNGFLFEEKGFTGNMERYSEPENCFINQVIDRHTGGPTSLCLLYVILMRKLGYQVQAIGMPGHAVCMFQSGSKTVFIDVFDLGKFLTRQNCIEHLIRCNHEPRDEYLAPMSTRRSLARISGNLEQIYSDLRQDENAIRFRRYLNDLSSNPTN